MKQDLKLKLIEQAGFHFRPSIENTISGIDWNCGSWGYDGCVDKLIELVVDECIGIADHSNVTGKSIIGERIKQHFGIK